MRKIRIALVIISAVLLFLEIVIGGDYISDGLLASLLIWQITMITRENGNLSSLSKEVENIKVQIAKIESKIGE